MSALDAIVSFADPARLHALSRAVFSLVLGDHRPINVIVVCQRFGPADIQAVHQSLAPLMTIAGDASLNVLNSPNPVSIGTHAALLNLGLFKARARYVALLDDDDVVYPEAHHLLLSELTASNAAIAFGGILEVSVCREGLVPVTTAKRPMFRDDGRAPWLQSDHCPLNSFVLDRQLIDPRHLILDESLPVQPAQGLLRRLCADYPWSVRLQQKILGECTTHSGKKSGTER